MNNKTTLWAAAILALGMMLSGAAISSGVHHFANKDRSVAVKGLSTRDVMADHAVWPFYYKIDGNDLPKLYEELGRMENMLKQFLMEQGFAESDIQTGNVSVNDNWECYYTGRRPEHQYTLNASLIVSTDNVELVRTSQGCQSKLLARGIILSSNEWALNYQFNGLSELKPSMIEEATKNARAVAQKFADDANCRLGSIRNAYQGQFSVESDEYCPWIKHVRVVTTIDYMLN